MDFVSNIPKAINMAREAYGDYERGRKVRLGNYKGAGEVKQLGHYNKQGRRLAIYHGS
jgi:hypothetical protein